MKLEYTKRGWGNKLPPTFSKPFKNDDEITTVTVSADFWCGPNEPGRDGHYQRGTFDEAAGFFFEVKGERKFFPRKPSTCSYEADLQKALKG